MRPNRLLTFFHWSIFTAVAVCCIFTIVKYWTLSAWPIIGLNAAVPPLLFVFFRKNTVNRLGVFMLCAPMVFIIEMIYIIVAQLPFPLDVANNLLAFVFTISLTLFALFGEYFTGRLRRHIDIMVYPLLVLNLAGYLLIYFRKPFNLTPYLLTIALLGLYYLLMVRRIRTHERMIVEQHQTIINTRLMMRSQVHDIANFVNAATGWAHLAQNSTTAEKRKERGEKAKASFARLTDHLRTIVGMLSDQKNLVQLVSMNPVAFLESLGDFLQDSFVGETRIVRGDVDDEFVAGTLIIAIPAICTGRSVFVDIQAFCTATFNLLANARKAGATAMRFLVDEQVEPAGLRIRIQDNGPGIPQSKSEMLFKERVESATGSGVGLIGVRMVIDCHDAKISVTDPNTDGQSRTEFTIETLKYISSVS
jgi:signal transduction histidine kinase